MRITKVDVRRLFVNYCQAMRLRRAKKHGDVGAYFLDYAPCYGGWTIRKFLDHGEEHLFSRLSTREIYEAMHFSLRMKEITRRKRR